MALVHLMAEMGLDFAIAHCNFQLRGEESKEDEDFVEELARNFDKKIYVKHFDTNRYISTSKLSVQMAARELRYAWFKELVAENKGIYVLTAHHADDSLETFLINLSRGTGIKGLIGIPERSGTILRPLLPFSRQNILAYAKSKGISWREDSSNLEKYYLRNQIRHELIPSLKMLNPAFLENFNQTQLHLRDISTILNNHIEKLKGSIFIPYGTGWKISVNSLAALAPLEGYLHALFADYGFREWANVKELLSASSGKQLFSDTYRLIKDREELILTPIREKKYETFNFKPETGRVQGPVPMDIDSVSNISRRSKHILYVDKETLNHRLEVRKWKKGDYFYPLGMKGRKLISKFFKDEKFDAIQKEEQWLLFSGDKLVWIIGQRADDRFKVRPQTKEILRFQLVE